MSNAKKFLFFAFVIAGSTLLGCSSINQVAGGSSSETVIGKIANADGSPAKNTIATLLQSDYNPAVLEPVEKTFSDTTDSNGCYKIHVPYSGSFCLQAVHLTQRTRLLISGINVQGDSTQVPPGVLRIPGTIKVPLCAGIDTANTYLYIPGTTIFSSLNNTNGFAVLDSVPAGTVPTVVYWVPNSGKPAGYIYNIQVVASDTVVATLQPVYVVKKTQVSVKIDGNLNEFSDITPITLESSAGARGDYRFMYDDSALYIGAKVFDTKLNSYIMVRDSLLTFDDCIELMFDTHHDRSVQHNSDDFKLFVNLQNVLSDSRGDGSPYWDYSWSSGCSSIVKLAGTLNNNTDIDSLYIIEIALPWRSLEMQAPLAGDTIGFDMVLNDRSSAGQDRVGRVWANTNGDAIIEDTVACRQLGECIVVNDPIGWGAMVFK